MIKAGKSYIYRTSLVEPLGRTLVRTGSHRDGNCFIHALLTAIDPKYRKQTSHYAQLKIVRDFRQQLSEWVTPELFRSLGKGEQLRLHFLATLNELLDERYSAGTTDPYEQLLRQIVDHTEIDQHILPALLSGPPPTNFYTAFCHAVDERVRRALSAGDPTRRDAFRTWVQKYFIEIFEQVHERTLAEFRARLERLGEWVDTLQMECIARFTGYNFLFIREREQDAYLGLSHVVTFDPQRQTLIFLWVDENHFEIIGELEQKTIINRIFDAEDELIQVLLKADPSNHLSDAKPADFALCA